MPGPLLTPFVRSKTALKPACKRVQSGHAQKQLYHILRSWANVRGILHVGHFADLRTVFSGKYSVPQSAFWPTFFVGKGYPSSEAFRQVPRPLSPVFSLFLRAQHETVTGHANSVARCPRGLSPLGGCSRSRSPRGSIRHHSFLEWTTRRQMPVCFRLPGMLSDTTYNGGLTLSTCFPLPDPVWRR
jgi:hypothetical protein